jgi:hypothetical protein
VEALSGLGVTARYQLDAEVAIAAHERGYRMARASDDVDAAALLAIELGYRAARCERLREDRRLGTHGSSPRNLLGARTWDCVATTRRLSTGTDAQPRGAA